MTSESYDVLIVGGGAAVFVPWISRSSDELVDRVQEGSVGEPSLYSVSHDALDNAIAVGVR
jgi:hypothetical protein